MVVMWKEKFLNKVVCGDCLELLKEIPDNSVDLVLTDPPYALGGYSGRGSFEAVINDDKTELELKYWIKQIFFEFKRILKDGGCFFVFIDYRHLVVFHEILNRVLGVNNVLVWDKELISMGRPFRNCYELIVFGYKGNPVFKRFDISNVLRFRRLDACNMVHPTEKPVRLFSFLIENFSNDDGIVLDSFLGSGTTAVACKRLNRNFIGIEIDPGYCKIAEKRLKNIPEKLKRWFEVKTW